MTAKLSRSRRVWRDFCRAGAALSAVMLGVSVVSVLSAQALPAGTAPVAGQVVSVTSGSTTSTWGLTLTSPDNKCPGDGNAGFKWSTYFVPASVDVATLTYNNFGPVPPAGVTAAYPLYSNVGSSPQINKNPGLGDGLISGTPAAFSFAPIADQSVPNGSYKIGYACHKDGQTERFWQTPITVSGSTATGFNFTVPVPAAPVLVSPLTVGDATVGGTFTHAVSDPPTTGYTVTATPASGSAVTKVLAAGVTSFSLTTADGVVNGTTYTVVVRATNTAGTSAASNSVTSPTVAPPPRAAVTNLVATPTSGQLAITWTAPTGPAPTGYQVAITVGGTGITGSPFSAGATVSAFTQTGLASGSYVVTVTPQHASPFIALPASTPAVAVPGVPAAPVLVSPLTVDNATVGGTFTHAVSDPPTTGYTVTATPGTGSVVTKALAAGATSFSLTAADGVVNGTTYTVVVRATNTAGTSAASNSVTSPTVAPPPRAAVTNLVATPTAGQLAITWTAPTGPAPTGYQVAITVGGTAITGSPFSAAASATSFTQTGLAAGSYVVTVTPQHASPFIALPASTPAVTVPAAPGVPAAPVLVSPLTVGDATVGGTFTHAVSNPPTTGYTVTATPGTGSVVTKALAAGATSFSLTAADGVVNGTTYTVVVRATNSVGTSAASNSVTSPTVAPPPRAAVTNLVATPTAGQLAITWTAPTGPAPIGYRIAVTIGGTLVGGSAFVVDAATTSITRTGLATGAYAVAVEPLHAFPFTAATATVQATVPAPTTTTTPTTTVAASSTTTTIVGAGGPTTTVRAITLPGLLPATGASGTATIVFWSLLLLVFGRMAILFARPVRVLVARSK